MSTAAVVDRAGLWPAVAGPRDDAHGQRCAAVGVAGAAEGEIPVRVVVRGAVDQNPHPCSAGGGARRAGGGTGWPTG